VAALDWATWHLNHQPKHATCQSVDWPTSLATCQPPYCHVNLPATSAMSASILSRHSATSTADVTHATCHPFSGDTCHLGIGPAVRPNAQICLTRVASWSCHMSPVPRQTCHVSIRTCHVSVRTDCTDCTVNNFFACLTYRTECDIFSIRSPFDKVNIPPESGRRDRRNGTRFRRIPSTFIFEHFSSPVRLLDPISDHTSPQ
jgi:hypothetical protein